jgi:Pyridoxal-dependent decarboxylase conserved domain
VLEGDPWRNLATFVTTWMEPEAQRIVSENLHRNFIDHAEYPISAEIEQRCIRMLADPFNAPGETTGCRTQGSSEAIVLGALSLKWKWKQRREAAGLPVDPFPGSRPARWWQRAGRPSRLPRRGVTDAASSGAYWGRPAGCAGELQDTPCASYLRSPPSFSRYSSASRFGARQSQASTINSFSSLTEIRSRRMRTAA